MRTPLSLFSLGLLLFSAGLSACGDSNENTISMPEGPDAPKPLFTLDVTKSERLARIHHTSANQHQTAVYEIRGTEGARLQRQSVISPNVIRVNSVQYFGENEANYISHVDIDGGSALLVGTPASVTMSPMFSSKGERVDYGLDRSNFAVDVVLGREAAVLLWEGGQFILGPTGNRVSYLERTPDEKKVQYRLTQRSHRWAIGTQVFTKKPTWYDLGGTDLWAYHGQDSDGHTVYVDHTAGETFDSLRDIHLDPDKDQLVYQAKKAKQWFVISESRAANANPSTKQGPFTEGVGRLAHHKNTNHYFGVARTQAGQVLVVGGDKNTAATSPAFKRIALQRFQTDTLPVALATSDAGNQVLLGATPGTAYKTLKSLSLADNDSTVAYIANNDAGVRVVLGTTEQRRFESIASYQLSKPSDRPVYVGKDGEDFFAMHEGKASSGFSKFTLFKTRDKDRTYWKVVKGEGEAVGFDTTVGKEFERITRLELTPADTIWYDGKRGEKVHRTIETTESSAFDALGPVVLTKASFDILYAARHSRLETKEVTEEEKTRTVETVLITDVTTRNGKKLGSFNRSMPGNQGKRYLGASTTELPRPLTIKDTDHVYYTALSDSGTSVGFNNRVDGPFASVKELKPRPTSNDVVYFAQKAETWACQEGASRGTELDSVTGRLSFTPDNQQVYYSGKKANTNYTFVGSEQYLSVKDMKLGPNKDLLVYRGERTDGWRLVVGGTSSNPFAEISSSSFTDDSYGVYANATNTDKSRSFLMKREGKGFVADGNWATTSRLSEYHNPRQVGGLRLDIETQNYVLIGNDEQPVDLSTLPDPKTHRVFVGMGRNPGQLNNGWMLTAIEDGQLVLRNGPTLKNLSRWQRGYNPEYAHILPLYSPYAYDATQGKTRGQVYMSEHYSKFTPGGFTNNDRFVAIGTQSGQQHFIIAEKRTQGFDRIDDIIPHPETPSNDMVALKTRSSDGREWVLTSADVQTTSLGVVDGTRYAEWTTPYVATGTNTLLWKGTHGGHAFEAAHDRRYDQVRAVSVSSVTGDLSYVGERERLESVFENGTHGPWYNRIRLFGVHEDSGTASYVGDHFYADDNDAISVVGPGSRWLSRVHNGETTGPFVDDIDHLYGGDSLATSVWSGQVDGLWALYKGIEKTTKDYRALGWMHRLTAEDAPDTYHFLGRKTDGDRWVEVHNGSEGTTVDAVVESADIEGELPEALSKVARNPGDRPSKTVLIDDKGRFDYRAISDTQHVFVRQGRAHAPVGTIGRTWYLKDGEHLAYEGFEGQEQSGPVALILNGTTTPLYEKLDRTPIYSKTTDQVYTIAKLLRDVDLEEESEENPEEDSNDKDATAHAVLVILTGTTESLSMISHEHYTYSEDGLAMLAEVGSGWQAWVNAELGPVMDDYGSPNPDFGETLADSRYVGTYEEDLFVMSTIKHTEALDSVSTLYRSGFDDGVFVYHGKRGHIERGYVGDSLVAEAEKVEARTLASFGPDLSLVQTDANEREQLLGKSESSFVEAAYNDLGTILGVTDLGKTHLDAGDMETSKRNVVWDLKVTATPPEGENEKATYELAWVGGVLKREEARVDVYLEKTIYAPKDGELTPYLKLREIPMPSKEEEDPGELEEMLEGAIGDAGLSDAAEPLGANG